jgi:hypothetical protein
MELQGYSGLKSPEVLKMVKARGICERPWEINLQDAKTDRSRKIMFQAHLSASLDLNFYLLHHPFSEQEDLVNLPTILRQFLLSTAS